MSPTRAYGVITRPRLQSELTDSRADRASETSMESEFLRAYGGPIRTFGDQLRSNRQGIVIALSRKAPRLLELMSQAGIDCGESTIITERAIPFLPREFFSGRSVLIVDDIVIVGTTLCRNIASTFRSVIEAASTVKILTVASDKRWFQTRLFVNSGGWTSPEDCGLKLDGNQTTIFCNRLIRSFRLLNKPYDIDHAIFYLRPDARTLDRLIHPSKNAVVHEITTSLQAEDGQREYTVLPEESRARVFLSKVLCDPECCELRIAKWRIYQESKSGELALVPIISLQVPESTLRANVGPFSDAFDWCNRLYFNLIAAIDSSQGTLQQSAAVYQAFSYLNSWLWGIEYLIQQGPIGRSNRPLTMLRSSDVQYLFGPELTHEIVKATEDGVRTSIPVFLDREAIVNGNVEPEVNGRPRPVPLDEWDDNAERLYSSIKDHLIKRRVIISELPLLDRLAKIFESLFFYVEMPFRVQLAQELSSRADVADPIAVMDAVPNSDRLQLGFTWPQILRILGETGIADIEDPKVRSGLSLALDLLVDAGVAVPIRYFDRITGKWERRYRYGEDQLSAKKSAVLFHKVAEFIRSQGPQPDRIKLEKIFVLLFEKIHRERYAELLLAPQDSDDVLELNVGMALHGAVLEVERAPRDTAAVGKFFSYWLEDIERGEHPLLRMPGVEAATPLPDDAIEDVLNFTKALLAVDHRRPRLTATDKRTLGNEDHSHLIAIATLCTTEFYLRALRKDLGIFVDWFKTGCLPQFSPVLEELQGIQSALKRHADDSKSTAERMKTTLARLDFGRAAQAADIASRKMALFRARADIAGAIDEHFKSLPLGLGDRAAYFAGPRFSLADKISQIVSSSAQDPPDYVQNLQSRLEALCQLVGALVDGYRECVQIAEFYATRTSTGKLARQSDTALRKRKSSLTGTTVQRVTAAVEIVESLYPAHPFAIGHDDFSWDEVEDALGNVRRLLLRLNQLIEVATRIFDENFSDVAWAATLRRAFPRERSETFFVVRYDVKKSTRNRENFERAGWFVTDMHSLVLKALARDIEAGRIVPVAPPHEEAILLAKSARDVCRLLLHVLEVAGGSSMRVRVAVASTWDSNREFKKVRREPFDERYDLLTMDQDDPGIALNYAIVTRLLQLAESSEDRDGNSASLKIAGLADGLDTFAFSPEVLRRLPFGGLVDSMVTRRTELPQVEGRAYECAIVPPQLRRQCIAVLQATAG